MKRMELIRPEDMSIWVPYAQATDAAYFSPALRQVQDSELAPFISDQAVTDILALDRESATDQAKGLYAFWKDYVRPYVVNCVFLKLCQTHGYIQRSQGFVKFTDRENTSTPIDRAERADLIQTYKGQRDRYLTKLLYEFDFKGQTFDGTEYEVNRNKYRTMLNSLAGINPIGSVNNRDMIRNRKFRL